MSEATAMRRINWQLSDDRKTARLSIDDGGNCLADIILTPEGLETTLA